MHRNDYGDSRHLNSQNEDLLFKKKTKYVKYTFIKLMIIKIYSDSLVYEGLQHVNLSNISRIAQLTAFLNRLSNIE